MAISDAQRARILELAAAGGTSRTIAAEVGCSKSTVNAMLRKSTSVAASGSTATDTTEDAASVASNTSEGSEESADDASAASESSDGTDQEEARDMPGPLISSSAARDFLRGSGLAVAGEIVHTGAAPGSLSTQPGQFSRDESQKVLEFLASSQKAATVRRARQATASQPPAAASSATVSPAPAPAAPRPQPQPPAAPKPRGVLASLSSTLSDAVGVANAPSRGALLATLAQETLDYAPLLTAVVTPDRAAFLAAAAKKSNNDLATDVEMLRYVWRGANLATTLRRGAVIGAGALEAAVVRTGVMDLQGFAANVAAQDAELGMIMREMAGLLVDRAGVLQHPGARFATLIVNTMLLTDVSNRMKKAAGNGGGTVPVATNTVPVATPASLRARAAALVETGA